MVTISRSPGQGWLAFFALIPLLQIVRIGSIRFSTAMGALWGAGLLGMLALTQFPGVRISVESCGLLIIVPTAFALSTSLIVRRIGFNPFVIAVVWTLVELALRPVGLPLGLAAGAVGSGALMSLIGGALGYILVAFLVIWANSAILSLLNRVCIRLPMPIVQFVVLPTIRTAAYERAVAPIRNDSICIARPRAPPIS
ncbi:MAG: hypothetical protein KF841_06925 [Phycisphaerae bacterium]|nr:hypothetical protein [Phycisphaerae bacterium]